MTTTAVIAGKPYLLIPFKSLNWWQRFKRRVTRLLLWLLRWSLFAGWTLLVFEAGRLAGQ